MGKQKRTCKRLEKRQADRKRIEGNLTELAQKGLIHESQGNDGKPLWMVSAEQQDAFLKILQHPEYWPSHWTDEQKDKMSLLRQSAIAKGLIR